MVPGFAAWRDQGRLAFCVVAIEDRESIPASSKLGGGMIQLARRCSGGMRDWGFLPGAATSSLGDVGLMHGPPVSCC